MGHYINNNNNNNNNNNINIVPTYLLILCILQMYIVEEYHGIIRVLRFGIVTVNTKISSFEISPGDRIGLYYF